MVFVKLRGQRPTRQDSQPSYRLRRRYPGRDSGSSPLSSRVGGALLLHKGAREYGPTQGGQTGPHCGK